MHQQVPPEKSAPNSQGQKAEGKTLKPEGRSTKADQTPDAQRPTPEEPWIPESKLPPLPKNSVNSIVRKILLTNPLFPRFYADMVIASAPNSNEAKILRTHYQKILNRISMPTSTTCTHIKVTGVRCASPSLRGEHFCYFHQHAHRGVRKPPQSRLHPIAILEDEESIQSSLMEVINALMRNTIDLKRAELILRALHIAVKNARRVKFDIHAGDTVKEIPEYARVGADAFVRPSGEAAVQAPAEANQPAEDELPHTAVITPARPLPVREQRDLEKLRQEQAHQADVRARLTRVAETLTTRTDNVKSTTTHVGTDAFVRTGGPEVPVRSASDPKPPIAAHNFKKTPDSKEVPVRSEDQNVPQEHAERSERHRVPQGHAKRNEHEKVPQGRAKIAQRFSAGTSAAIQKRAGGTPDPRPQTSIPRKPAATARAPKERQSTAHRVSGG